MNLFRSLTAALLAASLGAPSMARAAAACEGFKWDVRDVRALFAGAATPVQAGASAVPAPAIEAGRLYQLELHPQESVTFAQPPAKKTLADGASAGLVRLRMARAGDYRVAVDVPFWLDVVAGAQVLPSLDFNGDPACEAPRKIVVYALPADRDLILQFSGHVGQRVRVSVTAAP
ncbi:MAG: hypothetical protein QM661_04470 [Solimonas sp.]